MKILFSKIFIGIAAALIVSSSHASDNNTQAKIESIKNEKLQHIEDWYAQRLDWIMEDAELRASELPLPLRRIWTEFVKMSAQKPFADTYYLYANVVFLKAPDIELRNLTKDAYFLDKTRDILIRSDVWELLNSMIHSSVTSDKLRNKAIDLLNFMEEFRVQLKDLETQRQIRLAEYTQWAKNLQPSIETAQNVKPLTSELGVVSAISYDEKNVFGMIGDQIVYPNSVVNGIKVINIHRYKIEFQKDGKIWAQQVGGAADSAWNNK